MRKKNGATLRDQEYDLVNVDDLLPHPDNPRKGKVDLISESIAENGFYGAVVVQRGTNYILAGNHRWMAAKEVGLKQVPVVWVECDDLVAKRILLADNRTSDVAGYDEEKLGDLLRELQEAGMLKGSGYDAKFVANLLEELTDEPFYTRKVEVPIYEPREPEPPPLDALVETDKYEELLQRIEKAEGVPDDVKDFLRLAATRHLRFRYDRIAEYYAHAPAEVQALFEDSALVIIDYKSAIEKGFVKLMAALAEQFREEYGEE